MPADQQPTHRSLHNGSGLASLSETNRGWLGIGVWVRAGSRFENPREAGWAHLLEHLWFRGSMHYDAAGVDRTCDRLGGQVNAETGRELLGIWGLAPVDQGEELVSLVTDIFLYPRFDDSDVQAERRLIAAEAGAAAGDPLRAAADGLLDGLWGRHPIARPITGREESLALADAPSLHAWRSDRLVGPLTTGVTIGPGAATLADKLGQALARLPGHDAPSIPATSPPGAEPTPPSPPAPSGPAGLVWAVPLPGWCDNRYAQGRLALTAIAGGLSAILPAHLRRETGVAYDVGCHLETGFDASTGFIFVEAASAAVVASAVEERLDAIADDGLPAEAVATAAAQLEAQEALADTVPVEQMRLAAWQLLSGRSHSQAAQVSTAVTVAFGPAWRWRAHTR